MIENPESDRLLERRHFQPFLTANQDLTLRLLAVLCDRLRRTSVALEEIALFDLPARLARVLLQLANDYGRPTPAGTRIDFKLSQRDLSNLVASTRESVNKQLRICGNFLSPGRAFGPDAVMVRLMPGLRRDRASNRFRHCREPASG